MKRNTQKDLQLLAKAFFKNLQLIHGDGVGIGLDPKRPFGNRYWEGHILEIIGETLHYPTDSESEWTDEQLQYARTLYLDNLIPYLKTLGRKLK